MPIRTRSSFDTFQRLEQSLASGKRTFYTRFGDGDLYLLMGKSYRNHTFNEEIRTEMEAAILIDDPGYFKAMCVNYDLDPGMEAGLFTWYPDNDEMADFLSREYSPGTTWEFEQHYTFPYYALFKPAAFNAFFDEYVRPVRKLFVGGVDKQVAEQLYGPIQEYVRTPMKNAYAQVEDWYPEVERAAANVDLVIPSAGAASKVLNKRLWQSGFPGNSLDVGALIDWVNGRNSRKWIKLKGHKINDVLVPEHQRNSAAFRMQYAYKEAYYRSRRVWKVLTGQL